MKKCRLLCFMLLASVALECPSFAQIVGGRDSGQITPSEAKPADVTSGAYAGNVNLFSGVYSSNYPLATLSTPTGLNFTLSLNYSGVFSGGDNVPHVSGIPYGEGWDLNIPSITVSNAAYYKFTYSDISQMEGCYTPGCEGSFTHEELEMEGEPFWFAPKLNIPGVASGRMVLKAVDNKQAVFVLHKFEGYIEARFDGSDWYVNLPNGVTYTFSTRKMSDRNASNQRFGKEMHTDKNVANAIIPKSETLAWYVTRINNKNLPQDQIVFVYETYGGFDYYKEFRQYRIRDEVRNLLYEGADCYLDFDEENIICDGEVIPNFNNLSFEEIVALHEEMPWLMGPWSHSMFNPPYLQRMQVATDIFLKQVTAHSGMLMIERLDLDYGTFDVPPNQVNNMLLKGQAGVEAYDNLYNYKTVFHQGTPGGQAILCNNGYDPATTPDDFQNWKRYKHAMATPQVPGGSMSSPGNPYLVGVGSCSYYRTYDVPADNKIRFDHSFLESGKVGTDMEGNRLPAGELYEVKFLINAPSSGTAAFGNFDINIATGLEPPNITNTSGCGSLPNLMPVETYRKMHYKTLYSTFNQAIKWNPLAKKINSGGLTYTSNYFSMPNYPQDFGGIYIQIGPGNSDNKFDVAPEDLSIACPPALPVKVNNFKTYTYELDNPAAAHLKATDRITHNFGIGLPWYLTHNIYDKIGNNAGYDCYNSNVHYNFWWNHEPAPSTSWSNKPTLVGSGFELNSVELVRYSKNPYVLKGVKHYKVNGPVNNLEQSGLVLVKALQFGHGAMRVPVYDASSDPNDYVLKIGHDRNVFLLTSIVELPTDPSGKDAGFDLADYDVKKLPTTHFSYERQASDAYNQDLRSNTDVVALSKIVTPLGGVTELAYDPIDWEATLPSLTYNAPLPRLSIPELGIEYEYRQSRPAAFSIYPRVVRRTVSGGNGGPGKEWTYQYNERVLSGTTPTLNQHFRADNQASSELGYKFTRVYEPPPAAGEPRPYATYHHHYANFLLFGKLRQTENYNAGGQLIQTSEYQYTTPLAYEGFMHTAAYLSSIGTYYPEFSNPGSIHPEGLPTDYRLSLEKVRFYETHFAEDVEAHNSIATVKYLNSYFQKLDRKIDSFFDPETGLSYQTITDYKWFDADEKGVTQSEGYQYIFDGVAWDQQLKFDPSWQMFSSKTWSPELPDAYTTKQYFYTYDFVNRHFFSDPHRTIDLVLRYDNRSIVHEERVISKAPGEPEQFNAKYYLYDADWGDINDIAPAQGAIVPESVLEILPPCSYELDESVENPCGGDEGGISGGGGNVGSGGSGGGGSTDCVGPPPCGCVTGFATIPGYVHFVLGGKPFTCPLSSVNWGDFYVGLDNLELLDLEEEVTSLPSGKVNVAELLDYLYNLNKPLANTLLLRSVYVNTSMEAGDYPILQFTSNVYAPPGSQYGFEFPAQHKAERVYHVDRRNRYGQVQEETNARGMRTYYEYQGFQPIHYNFGETFGQYHCYNFTSYDQYNIGVPLFMTQGYGETSQLNYKYRYNPDYSIDQIEGPNGDVTSYAYDHFGRLGAVAQNGTTLNTYGYGQWQNDEGKTFKQRTDQNHVESKTFFTPDKAIRSRAYVDPLGRTVATLSRKASASDVVLPDFETVVTGHSFYDDWDRALRIQKPYTQSGFLPAATASGPSVQNVFENDPRSRLLESYKYGETDESVRFGYGFVNGTDLPGELGLTNAEVAEVLPGTLSQYVLLKQSVVDEDGKVAVEYLNAFGGTVASKKVISPSGGDFAVTLFRYGSGGNAKLVINPEKQKSVYGHNLMGWLTRKQTPDTGETLYEYDLDGSLKRVQDANGMKGENFAGSERFYLREFEYDHFARATQQHRVYIDHPWEPDPDGIARIEPSGWEVTEKRWEYDYFGHFYDIDYPPDLVNQQNEDSDAGLQNERGRLTSTTSYNYQGEPVARNFYAYNDFGHPRWQIKQFNPYGISGSDPGMLARFDYECNLAGNITQENVQLLQPEQEAFGYTYRYDDWNRLEEVYVNLEKSHQLAAYDYDPASGLLEQTRYYDSDDPLCRSDEVVDNIGYEYDVRNRLTKIGSTLFDWDLYYGSQSAPAAVNQQFNHNGNINASRATYKLQNTQNAPPGFEHPTTYGYAYDGLNRLVSANALCNDFAAPQTGTTSYSYDKLGNILRLNRHTAAEGPQILNYLYQNGSNRLEEVTYSISKELTYDANGNLTGDDSKGLTQATYGRANLPHQMQLNGQPVEYLYDAADARIYKYTTTDTGNQAEEYHLRDINGNSIGIYDYVAGKWTWYVFGNQRFARFTPRDYSQPFKPLDNPDRVDWQHGDNIGKAKALAGIKYPDELHRVEYTHGGNQRRTGYILESRLAALLKDRPGLQYKILSSETVKTEKEPLGAYTHDGKSTQTLAKTFVDYGDKLTWHIAYNKAAPDVVYYIHDHLGNTRLTYQTTPDCKGQATYLLHDVVDYFPYGKSLRSNGGAERYLSTHHQRDPETGWDHRGARLYDGETARFLGVDPLAADYPAWSGYNYTLNNPILLIDLDGREPVKSFVGTSSMFRALLDNSPRKVGAYTGDEASNYLKSLGNTKFNWKQVRPLPTQTGYFNTKKGRYIYTRKGGWIDMTHFMFYAGKAYKYKLDGEKHPIGEAVQDGYYQETTDRYAAKHSAYSYEDLPSDKFGADFAVNHFDPESELSFGEQLENYLNNVLEATDPENAPNYDNLPEEDTKNPPTRTNKTTTPVYTEDNP